MINLYIIASVFIISLISLLGAITLSWKKEFLKKVLFVFVGLAAGALFGDALLHLIPEALAHIPNPLIASLLVIAGILIFFALEKFLLWHHSHDIEEDHTHPIVEDDQDQKKIKPLGVLVLASDSVHNLIDGVIIAASFMISVEVGIATTIAVALHEIPQEIADFALLVHSGMSRARALAWNFATALFAMVGAGATILLGTFLEPYIFHIGAFAAGAFLYIAGSDLVPEIHKTRDFKRSSIQFVSILVGIALMIGIVLFEGDHAHGDLHGHDHEDHEGHLQEHGYEDDHHDDEDDHHDTRDNHLGEDEGHHEEHGH